MQLLVPTLFAFVLLGSTAAIWWRVQHDQSASASAAPVQIETLVPQEDEQDQPAWTPAPGQRYRDIKVWIERVRVVNQLNARDEVGTALLLKQRCIVVDIRVKNSGEENTQYQSWQSQRNATLSINDQAWSLFDTQDYAKVELHTRNASTELDPGSVIRDSVIFIAPMRHRSGKVRLALPASNISGDGTFGFEVPVTFD